LVSQPELICWSISYRWACRSGRWPRRFQSWPRLRNVQCASAGWIWSRSLNNLLASNSPSYFVLRPWMAVWMPSVLARPKSSASYPVQSMVFFWISIILDSSAEITWSMVRM
jgi:hypothetical protein